MLSANLPLPASFSTRSPAASPRQPEVIAACTPSNQTMLDYSRYFKTGNFKSKDFATAIFDHNSFPIAVSHSRGKQPLAAPLDFCVFSELIGRVLFAHLGLIWATRVSQLR